MGKLFEVNNKDTRAKSWCCSGVFIVNFEQISHIALVFFVDFVQVNVGREIIAIYIVAEKTFPKTIDPLTHFMPLIFFNAPRKH